MQSLIITYGLKAFIDGSIVEPQKFLDLNCILLNPRYCNQNRMNSMMTSQIYASISREMSNHVLRRGTVFVQWRALDDMFSSSANSQILDLLTQLQTLHKDGLSMTDYITKACTLSYHLTTIKEHITKNDLVKYVLSGLSTNTCYNLSLLL